MEEQQEEVIYLVVDENQQGQQVTQIMSDNQIQQQQQQQQQQPVVPEPPVVPQAPAPAMTQDGKRAVIVTDGNQQQVILLDDNVSSDAVEAALNGSGGSDVQFIMTDNGQIIATQASLPSATVSTVATAAAATATVTMATGAQKVSDGPIITKVMSGLPADEIHQQGSASSSSAPTLTVTLAPKANGLGQQKSDDDDIQVIGEERPVRMQSILKPIASPHKQVASLQQSTTHAAAAALASLSSASHTFSAPPVVENKESLTGQDTSTNIETDENSVPQVCETEEILDESTQVDTEQDQDDSGKDVVTAQMQSEIAEAMYGPLMAGDQETTDDGSGKETPCEKSTDKVVESHADTVAVEDQASTVAIEQSIECMEVDVEDQGEMNSTVSEQQVGDFMGRSGDTLISEEVVVLNEESGAMETVSSTQQASIEGNHIEPVQEEVNVETLDKPDGEEEVVVEQTTATSNEVEVGTEEITGLPEKLQVAKGSKSPRGARRSSETGSGDDVQKLVKLLPGRRRRSKVDTSDSEVTDTESKKSQDGSDTGLGHFGPSIAARRERRRSKHLEYYGYTDIYEVPFTLKKKEVAKSPEDSVASSREVVVAEKKKPGRQRKSGSQSEDQKEDQPVKRPRGRPKRTIPAQVEFDESGGKESASEELEDVIDRALGLKDTGRSPKRHSLKKVEKSSDEEEELSSQDEKWDIEEKEVRLRLEIDEDSDSISIKGKENIQEIPMGKNTNEEKKADTKGKMDDKKDDTKKVEQEVTEDVPKESPPKIIKRGRGRPPRKLSAHALSKKKVLDGCKIEEVKDLSVSSVVTTSSTEPEVKDLAVSTVAIMDAEATNMSVSTAATVTSQESSQDEAHPVKSPQQRRGVAKKASPSAVKSPESGKDEARPRRGQQRGSARVAAHEVGTDETDDSEQETSRRRRFPSRKSLSAHETKPVESPPRRETQSKSDSSWLENLYSEENMDVDVTPDAISKKKGSLAERQDILEDLIVQRESERLSRDIETNIVASAGAQPSVHKLPLEDLATEELKVAGTGNDDSEISGKEEKTKDSMNPDGRKPQRLPESKEVLKNSDDQKEILDVGGKEENNRSESKEGASNMSKVTEVLSFEQELDNLVLANNERRVAIQAGQMSSSGDKVLMQSKIDRLQTLNSELRTKVKTLEKTSPPSGHTEKKIGIQFSKMKFSFRRPNFGSPSGTPKQNNQTEKNAVQKQREIELAEQELKAREVHLEKREQKAKALDKELDERTSLLKVREGKLDRWERKLKSQEKELEYREKQMKRMGNEQKGRDNEEDKKQGKLSKEMEKKIDDLGSKRSRLDSVEKILKDRERDVKNHELILKDKKKKLEQQEKELQRKSCDINEKERLLTTTEAELTALGNDLSEKYEYLKIKEQSHSSEDESEDRPQSRGRSPRTTSPRKRSSSKSGADVLKITQSPKKMQRGRSPRKSSLKRKRSMKSAKEDSQSSDDDASPRSKFSDFQTLSPRSRTPSSKVVQQAQLHSLTSLKAPLPRKKVFSAKRRIHGDKSSEKGTKGRRLKATDGRSSGKDKVKEKPRARSVSKEKPRARSVSKPRARSVTKEKPRARSVTKEKQRARSVSKEKPRARSITKEKPRARSITKEKPRARSVSKPRPKSVTKEKPRARSVSKGRKSTSIKEAAVKSTPTPKRATPKQGGRAKATPTPRKLKKIKPNKTKKPIISKIIKTPKSKLKTMKRKATTDEDDTPVKRKKIRTR